MQTIEIIKDFLGKNYIAFECNHGSKSAFKILIDSLNIELYIENQKGVEFIIKNLDNRSNIYNSLIEIDNKSIIDFHNEILNELQNVLNKAQSIQKVMDEIISLCNKEDLNIYNIKLGLK